MESQRSLIKLWLVIVILFNFFGSLLFVIHFLSQFFVVVTKKKDCLMRSFWLWRPSMKFSTKHEIAVTAVELEWIGFN